MKIKDLLSNEVTQQEILNYYNASISYVSLNKGINGFVFSYKGINNIIINNNLSYYKKRKTILHELAHIELNHLNQYDKDMYAFCIDKLEDEANKYLKDILSKL